MNLRTYFGHLREKAMNFRIRASLMGDLAIWNDNILTERQNAEYNKLLAKIGEGKELTLRQKEILQDYRTRLMKGPELTTGGKTALNKVLAEWIYGYRTDLYGDGVNKGIIVEDESIDLLNKFDRTSYKKNTEEFRNDYVTGTPDIIDHEKRLIIDIKSSYTADTFPLFKQKLSNSSYEWQVKTYAWLLGFWNAQVIYVLTNTPGHIVQRELYRFADAYGIIDIPEQAEEYIKAKHNYDDVPLALRIKKFDVSLHKKDIEKMKKTVKMAREYLLTEIKNLENQIVK